MKILPSSPGNAPIFPCALQQSQEYARAVCEMGATTENFSAMENGVPIARFQLIRRRIGPLNIAWLPRGPLWSGAISDAQKSEIFRKLRETSPDRAIWIVAPDCESDCHYFRNTPLMSPQFVAEINLSPDHDALLGAQNGKWRNRLRHAQASGLRVLHRAFNISRDLDVLINETAQGRLRKYKSLPPEFMRAWAKNNPKCSRLFTVWRGQNMLALLLVLLHKPIATYHIGWSGGEGRRFSAHNLGLWEATKWLAKKGYTRFDLGSVDTQHNPGLARFKIGSGAKVRSLGPTCLYLPQLSFRWRARHAAA